MRKKFNGTWIKIIWNMHEWMINTHEIMNGYTMRSYEMKHKMHKQDIYTFHVNITFSTQTSHLA